MAASAPVSGTDLARDDARLAALYLELATRHDSLVDWVNAKILGLK